MLVVGLVVAHPSPAGAATGCNAETPEGMVRVAIVVDFGTRSDAPGGPSVGCLVLPAGSTGGDLLRDRATLLGTPKPRYSASGLLCALDGYPTSGCGETTGGGYLYWSYWSGTTGTWVYGSGNPFTRRLHDGDIEGWRFSLGAGGPQDPPPRTVPDASRLFPQAPPSSSTGSTPPTAGAAGGASSGSGGGAPASGDAGASAQGSNGANGGAEAPGDAGSAPAGGGDGTSRQLADQAGQAAGDGVSSIGSPTDGDAVGVTEAAGGSEQVAEEPASSTAASSFGTLFGLIVGVAVIAGLGTAAFARFRRGPEQ